MTIDCRCLSCIMPPYILKRMLENTDKNVREAALRTIVSAARLRGERAVRSQLGRGTIVGTGRRSIFDSRGSEDLQVAVQVRSETDPAVSDAAVNRAFDGLGMTRKFFKDVFDRNSLDGNGLSLRAFVHFGDNWNNAAWDGDNMLFGDGDGVVFTDFTKSLDVIGHELTHGLIQHTANLKYELQPGALNESLADVFGTLVKQWSKQQSAAEADWLIGADIATPLIAGDALRSLKAPGTAHDNAIFGKDPQPSHMSGFVVLPNSPFNDHGGVHINSGIPNKAFYLASMAIGGFAWEAPGLIWYEALKASERMTEFQEFAETTVAKADQLYGANSNEHRAVINAWREVGLRVRAVAGRSRGRDRAPDSQGREAEALVALTRKVEQMSLQLNAFAGDLASLKQRGSHSGDTHAGGGAAGAARDGGIVHRAQG